ncbi:MAG: FAD-dependent thymidylate synthase [Planctomycetes bacterium]|nr:FAD-dependent thymidylate synthase [Planctomycetota bacterium]
MTATGRSYSEFERRLLSTYFSVVDSPEHADIYLVRNLPQEVAATLNGVYSRSSKSMRDQFLDRLQQGLEAQGRRLEDMPLAAGGDPLSGVMTDKAGQFLKTYAIDHGHNSLREGAVVHLAVEKVSQLVTRFVQRERRCSFEESSTRYISFSAESHWRDPDVAAAGGEIAAAYERVLATTFALYQQASETLLEHLKRERPLQAGEKEGPWLRTLKAEAFDAARYLLTPAIRTKWGMVADARTLSDVISELASHPLAEFRLVGERMRQQAEQALPTLLRHAGESAFQRALRAELPRVLADLGIAPPAPRPGPAEPTTLLLSHDPELDDRLLASLLYEPSGQPFAALMATVKAMTGGQRAALLERLMAQRGRFDPWPLALEGAMPFDFELLVDFGAYRDIGRHRKSLQQMQTMTTAHGFAVPPLLAAAGLADSYAAVLERAAADQQIVAAEFPDAAAYVTPFAFLQRVRIQFDPRQTAYFVELRSGPEGHFSYRQVALEMFAHVREVSPLFARFIRAQEGGAFLGRLESEMTADERRLRRMQAAGDS